MGFNLMYWTPMGGFYFLVGSILKNVENFGKTAVFPGGYDRIGEILDGRIWPDRGYGVNYG